MIRTSGKVESRNKPVSGCERPVSECEEAGGGWFGAPTEHAFGEPGAYEVTITATSVGCDGDSIQKDSAERTLEFPPEQGS